jgi:hypothetical protein
MGPEGVVLVFHGSDRGRLETKFGYQGTKGRISLSPTLLKPVVLYRDPIRYYCKYGNSFKGELDKKRGGVLSPGVEGGNVSTSFT